MSTTMATWRKMQQWFKVVISLPHMPALKKRAMSNWLPSLDSGISRMLVSMQMLYSVMNRQVWLSHVGVTSWCSACQSWETGCPFSPSSNWRVSKPRQISLPVLSSRLGRYRSMERMCCIPCSWYRLVMPSPTKYSYGAWRIALGKELMMPAAGSPWW